MSQFIFCLVCIAAFAFSAVAERRNSKLALIICIVILSVFSGLRAPTVGVDTGSYFYNIENGFPYVWQFDETGFRYISNMLMSCFHDAGWVLLFYAITINLLVVLRLWDYRDQCSFSYMVLLYIMMHFVATMNITRQYVSLAIVFYATRYLNNKKYIIFSALLMLAISIHMVSAICVGYLGLYIWENSSKKNRKYLLLPAIIIVPSVVYVLVNYERSHISNYFSNSLFQINFPYIYRALVFIIALCLQRPDAPNIVISSVRSTNKMDNYLIINQEYRRSTIFYAIGLMLSSLGMFFRTLNRLGLFYLPYELVFLGTIKKRGKSGEVCALLMLVYAVYVFTANLLTEGSGIFPFSLRLPG